MDKEEEFAQLFDRAGEVYMRVSNDPEASLFQKSCLKLAAYAKLRASALRMSRSVERETALRIVNELDDEVNEHLQGTGCFEMIHRLYTKHKKEIEHG